MNSLRRQFTSKDHGPLVQFCKYAIAGGIATVVHYFIFYLMSWKVLPALTPDDFAVRYLHLASTDISDSLRAWYYVINFFTAFMISNFVVYFINIRWVFEAGRHSRRKELGLFYLVAGISVGIGVFLSWALINYYGLNTTPTVVINTVICLLINYAARKFFIFKH